MHAHHGVELAEYCLAAQAKRTGTVLTWEVKRFALCYRGWNRAFFIVLGKSPHPALVASRGATLVGLRAEHPDADRVLRMLR